MSKRKIPAKRNPMARELAKSLYRQRVVESVKSYTRKAKNRREEARYYSEDSESG